MAFVNLLQAMYPVGSCYFSTVNTSPATIVGGTWAAMTGGMLGLAGSTGVAGAANNGGSRKISTSQMPSHSHEIWTTGSVQERTVYHMSAGNISSPSPASRENNGLKSVYEIAKATGGGADYIPAHTSVYGWRRTA